MATGMRNGAQCTLLALNVKQLTRFALGRLLDSRLRLWYNDRQAGDHTRKAIRWIARAPTPNNAMHELPVTQAILDTAIHAAQQAGGQRILAIDLVIGELSGIVDDSVQFYFDILSQGTLAAGAALRMQRQPASAVCLDCGHSHDAAPPLAPFCAACGSLHLQVTGGRQFQLESIEIDDQDPSGAADP